MVHYGMIWGYSTQPAGSTPWDITTAGWEVDVAAPALARLRRVPVAPLPPGSGPIRRKDPMSLKNM